MAAAVTVADAILAFPLALLHGAGRERPVARRRSSCWCCCRSGRATSSASTLADDPRHNGAPQLGAAKVGLPAANIAYTNMAMWLVYSYVWLPFMVLPVYAALERIPESYLEASRDLGARGWRTFRARDPAARAARASSRARSSRSR